MLQALEKRIDQPQHIHLGPLRAKPSFAGASTSSARDRYRIQHADSTLFNHADRCFASHH